MQSRLPIYFEPNQDQHDPEVLYLSQHGGQTLFLTKSEAVLVKGDSLVRVRLAGAQPAESIMSSEQLPGRINYFIGNDRSKWRTDIPIFARVQYKKVYAGQCEGRTGEWESHASSDNARLQEMRNRQGVTHYSNPSS